MTGTKVGSRTGALLVLCQCCVRKPQILAECAYGKLTIETRREGEPHYVVLGDDLCARLEGNAKIACACCDEDDGPRPILAECLDGLLIIRDKRHGRVHFVAISALRLERLLAATRAVRYHSAENS